MDESKIAAQVAQRIPQPEPNEPPKAEVATEDENKGYIPSLDHSQFNGVLQDYFAIDGVDKYDSEVQNMVKVIQRWAYDTAQTTNSEKALLAIRSLEQELGASFKPDRLQRLAKFIKLKEQSNILRMQMDAVKRS